MDGVSPIESKAVMWEGVSRFLPDDARSETFRFSKSDTGVVDCTVAAWSGQVQEYVSLVSKALVHAMQDGQLSLALRVAKHPGSTQATVLDGKNYVFMSADLLSLVALPALRLYLVKYEVYTKDSHVFEWEDKVRLLVSPKPAHCVTFHPTASSVVLPLWKQVMERSDRCGLALSLPDGTTYRVHSCVMAGLGATVDAMIPTSPSEAVSLPGITSENALVTLIQLAYQQKHELTLEGAMELLDFALAHGLESVQLVALQYVSAHVKEVSSAKLAELCEKGIERTKRNYFLEVLAHREALPSPTSVVESLSSRYG